jgi:putative spermidine/putrescine transport system permease protein
VAQAASENVQVLVRPPRLPRFRPRWLTWNWIGILPFVLFVVAFQLYPASSVVIRSFLDQHGRPTLDNILNLNQPVILGSYRSTIELSLITAVWGGTLGFLLAWSVTRGGLPDWMRSGVVSFAGIASNFAGIPLVFAFISTIGRLGVVTKALNSIGIPLYPYFTLYGFWGICITYTYFQIPLMVLIMTPALDGLKKEWSEAAENLGASRFQYWRHVGFPILLPCILGALALLFANAFGAYATAYALVAGGSGQNLVISVMVGSQFSSDTFTDPGLGNALAFGMIVVIAVTIIIYSYFRRLSERWLR